MVTRYARFTAAIAGIGRSIQKIETTEMRKYGLKGSHATFLVTMAQRPDGVTAAELCRLCDKDKAAVSRALAELEEKNMIVREGNVAYRMRLRLTDKGAAVASAACKKVETAVRLANKDVSEAELESLYGVLDRMAKELHRAGQKGLPEE